MNGGNLYAQSAEGHNGRWNCTLCAEWGMKANVSVSWHDSVEYKWYCHWVLQKVSREFHSSKLHYLDRPEGIVSEWLEGKKLSAQSRRYYRTTGCRLGKQCFSDVYHAKLFRCYLNFFFGWITNVLMKQKYFLRWCLEWIPACSKRCEHGQLTFFH